MEIEKRPRQFLAVWSDDGKSIKGSSFEESLFVDGTFLKNEISNVPLDGFDEIAKLFSSDLHLQNTQLQSDNAKLTSDLEASTKANTSLESQIANLTSQVSVLEEAAEAAKQLNATLQVKVTELEQYRPYNPRILAGKAFYNRVSKEDLVTLLTSAIPQLVIVGKTIEAYRVNDWPVILDSQDFQNLVGYVLQSGIFDEGEVTAIMRDATREESYEVKQ
jgi:hypothetical protein